MRKPKVSIVVVNYNGGVALTECIRSLLKTNYKHKEIILVDNNSTDGSVEAIGKKFPSVKLIKNNKNVGFGAAINIGFEKSDCNYLVAMDNDVVVHPDWLRNLMAVMEKDESVGACQANIKPLGREVNLPKGIKTIEIPYACTAAAIFKREALNDIKEDNNYFDPDYFFYYDDTDLGFRLKWRGWKIKKVLNSIVYHKGGATTSRVPLHKAYLESRNKLICIVKNFPFRLMIKNLIFVPIQMFVSILKTLLLERRCRCIPSLVRGYFDGLRAFSTSLRKRKKIQARRKVCDEIMEKEFKFYALFGPDVHIRWP